ncbi:SUN domain-containing protein 1, partial [Trichinella pseudospiralis]
LNDSVTTSNSRSSKRIATTNVSSVVRFEAELIASEERFYVLSMKLLLYIIILISAVTCGTEIMRKMLRCNGWNHWESERKEIEILLKNIMARNKELDKKLNTILHLASSFYNYEKKFGECFDEHKMKEEPPIENDKQLTLLKEVGKYYSEKKWNEINFEGAKILDIPETEPYPCGSLLSHWTGYRYLTFYQSARKHDTKSDECWTFKGNKGNLIIGLKSNVLITGFSYEHSASSNETVNYNKLTAPKEINFYGLVNLKDKKPWLFGSYIYNANISEMQYFSAERIQMTSIIHVEIIGNYGNMPYTCIHRFRVYGILPCEFIVYKLPGGKSSHYLLPNAAAAWTGAADIDAAQQPVHSTMNLYFASGNKDRANIVAYSNYPPHFKFELPMSPGKGVIIAEEQNKGFWLVHTAKYFPNIAGTVATLFSDEKTTKDAAAFLCMSYSDRSSVQATQAFYDSAEIQTLINGLHKYQPIGAVSGDSIRTLTAPGTVKIFATAPVAYSSDIYSNYVVKILKKTLQVYTPGTTTTVLRKSCAGTLKVENVLGPITVSGTVIPIEQDSARWSVPKSDIDFVCLSNTGRTADDAKHGATVACILSADATNLFRSMITKENLDACPFIVYKLPGGKSSHYLLPTAAAAWTGAADIDAAQQPVHSTMNLYFASGNKDRANIVAYSNYPPHFKFELPMSPGKGVIIAEEANKGFWLVHTAKYFPNIAGTVATLFSNEKTTKDAAAFLCMSYSDRSSVQATQAFYDSAEIQTLINGLHKYQPIGTVSGDSIRTLTAPGTVKIFATAPVAYSSDIYSNYVVKILKKTLQVYTPGTTTTVLRKSCAGTLKVENVLGPITVSDTVIPIEQDSARWSVPKSDIDFVCLSNTGRTADDAKHGATVACILSADATNLFRSMITKENLDACP